MTELFGLNSSSQQNQGNALYPGFNSADIEGQKPILDEASIQNTLDEPVSETIKRDLYMIYAKLRYVITPMMREEGAKELRDWDLWGPLVLCLSLAFILSLKASNSSDVVFGTIFIIIWGGASVLTLNARFLGGQTSFFQSVCVLGYCVFPIVLAAGGITIVEIFFSLPFIVNMAICGFGFFWAVVSSIGFMQALVSEEKRMLAAYPVVLFYMSLSWFVLLACSG